MWVVTVIISYTVNIVVFQSTPPVWVVTEWTAYQGFDYEISIHTTRVGGDLSPDIPFLSAEVIFQSTPPVWVVTDFPTIPLAVSLISIHTTRVGGDNE